MNQNYVYLSAFLSEFENDPDPLGSCIETVSELLEPMIITDDTPSYEVSTLYANDLSFDTPLQFLEKTAHSSGISIILLFTTNLERAAMFGAMVDSLKKSRGCEKSLYVIPIQTMGLPPQECVELFSDFYYQMPSVSSVSQTPILMPLFLQAIADVVNNKPIPDFTESVPIDRLSPAEIFTYFLQAGYAFNVIMGESDNDDKDEMLEILTDRIRELGSIEADDLHTDADGLALFEAFSDDIYMRSLVLDGLSDQLGDEEDDGDSENSRMDLDALLDSILQDLAGDEDEDEDTPRVHSHARLDPSELFDDWDDDEISSARMDPDEDFFDEDNPPAEPSPQELQSVHREEEMRRILMEEERMNAVRSEEAAMMRSMRANSSEHAEYERRLMMERARLEREWMEHNRLMMDLDSAPKRESTPRPDVRQVQFSAVYSETMRRGEYSVLQIVMFEEAFQQAVEQAMAEIEGKAKKTTSGVFEVETKTKVKVVLSSPEAEISDPVAEAIWYGKHQNFEFDVYIPEDLARRQILFTAQIYFNGAIATRLKFFAKCEGEPEPIRVERHDILSAFVSYASPDRNAVSCIVQGLKKARPDLQIFFDVESLRSGEDWESQLRHRIFDCDILFLCWSHHAKESKWVEYEWRYALENKGIDCIEPIPLEDPSVCVPPTELQSKHFNDLMVYIRK